MKQWPRNADRAWQRGSVALNALLVGLLCAVLVYSVATAWIATQRAAVERILSEATDAPARIGALSLDVRGFMPRVHVRDARLLMAETGTAPLRLDGLRFGVALLPLLRGEVVPHSVEIHGLQIRLNEDADANWRIGVRERRVRPDIETIASQLAQFDRVSVELLRIIIQPFDAPEALPLLVERADLRPESGGWRVTAKLQTGARDGQLTLEGLMLGKAERPADWRQQWQVRYDGHLDLDATLGVFRPDLRPLPRIEGLRLRAALRRQGSEASRSWLVTMDSDASGVRLADGVHVRDPGISATARLNAEHLSVDVSRLSAEATRVAENLRLRWKRSENILTLRAERFGLAMPTKWLTAWRTAHGSPAWPAASGNLREVSLGLQPRAEALPALSVEGRLDDLAIVFGDVRVEGLSGVLDGTHEAGHLAFDEAPLRIALPRVLSETVLLDQAAGHLRWQHEAATDDRASRWQVTLTELLMVTEGLSAEGHADLTLAAAAPPELNVALRVRSDDINAIKPLMPLQWNEKLRGYLGESIRAANVPEATLEFFAALDGNIWQRDDTRLAIDAAFAGAQMRFLPDWPTVSDARGRLNIDRKGLSMDVQQLRFGGMAMADARLSIADFRTPELKVALTHGAALPQWYALIADTPLATPLRGLLEQTRAGGSAELDLDIDVPLRNARDVVARGRIGLAGARIHVLPVDLTIEDLHGGIFFANRAVASENLRGVLGGKAVSARIETRDGIPVLEASTTVDVADADGPAKLIPDWLQPQLRGELPVQLTLDLARRDGASAGTVRIDTRELTAALPLPMTLAPAASRPPSTLRLTLADGGLETMQLRLPGLATILRRGAHTRVHLGPGLPDETEPAADGLHLSGTAETLDLPAWLALLRSRSPEGAEREGEDGAPMPGLQGVDLAVADLRFGRVSVPDLSIRMTRDGNDLGFLVNGSSKGEIDFDPAGRGRLRGRFESLGVAYQPDGSVPIDADSKTKGAKVETAPQRFVDPAVLPAVDMLVSELLLGDLRLGELDLRLESVVGGLSLEQLTVADGALSLDATGAWRPLTPDAPASMQLEWRMQTAQIDALLSRLGFASTLRANRFQSEADLQWPDMTSTLSLASAVGTLSLRATNGALSSVEPGAGRAFGLFSFFSLPRRLALDFRDVTESGLAFDRLGGDFRLSGGNARTDNLDLEGPSLRVEVRGRVGLAAQDFDQRIRVYPDISGGVTLGGAILGGPIGIGLSLLAQELFEVPLEAVTRISYRLVGPWNDPRILPGEVATTKEAGQ